MSEEIPKYGRAKKQELGRGLSKLLQDQNPSKKLVIEITEKELEALKNLTEKLDRAWRD